MKMDQILISVLMPAYNASSYIGKAIDSVLEQSFKEFELIIIDDGSTDSTAQIIRSYTDTRIVLIQQPNSGVAGALNFGLKRAKAEYIARFDADDICYPQRLDYQFEFMRNNPDCVVLGSGVDYVDADGNFVFSYMPLGYTEEQIKALDYSRCPFIHSSVIFRKSAIMEAGGYNQHAHNFEDHFLWLNIKNRGKFYNLEKSLVKVRLNPGSVTIDEKWRVKEFIKIKYRSLKELDVSKEDGERLLEILNIQNNRRTKAGSYYALLAKKFLWNNYQPRMVRRNIKKAIVMDVFNIINYSVLIMSYLPRKVVAKIYNLVKSRNR
jgi:glycosyltransferase involved in cell wall biosynthesis